MDRILRFGLAAMVAACAGACDGDPDPQPDAATPDAEVAPDAAQNAYICIESSHDDWTRSGSDICRDQGLRCAGVAYHENSIDCTDGAPYTGCWGSTPTACCQYPMSDHAGAGAGRSASWTCQSTCPDGSELAGDTCVDIDECARNLDDCGADATCINQIGAFRCVCDIGYTGDGYTCTPAGPDPACVTSSDAAWMISGDEYCASYGLSCGGVDYHGATVDCGETPNSECWGSDPATCCSYPMSDHAGIGPGASAFWNCL